MPDGGLGVTMLTRQGCWQRQVRLREALVEQQCDAFVTGHYRTVYYLTGAAVGADAPAIFALWLDGRSLLVAGGKHDAEATDVREVETYSIERSIDTPLHDAVRILADALTAGPVTRRYMVERADTPALVEAALCATGVVDGTQALAGVRKRKEEDEVDEIRACLKLCAAAYGAARTTIAPGRTELDVYAAMYAAVVKEAGTAVTFPGDFACGLRAIRGGGPPTARVIEEHDLYVLDLFPSKHLYFADTCRTFAASTPTEAQQRAWEAVDAALRLGATAIRPGVGAREVDRLVREFLNANPVAPGSFWHHTGHGIGYRGHEAPRVIPGSADVFAMGDVVALEPGIYAESLSGGVRLENNYVVRESGVENLFDFPLGL